MLDIKHLDFNDIEKYFDMLESDFIKLCDEAEKHTRKPLDAFNLYSTKSAVLDALVCARCFNIERKKRSQGGQKSASNMSAEQRSERARRAGSTKKSPNKNRTPSI